MVTLKFSESSTVVFMEVSPVTPLPLGPCICSELRKARVVHRSVLQMPRLQLRQGGDCLRAPWLQCQKLLLKPLTFLRSHHEVTLSGSQTSLRKSKPQDGDIKCNPQTPRCRKLQQHLTADAGAEGKQENNQRANTSLLTVGAL